MKCRVCGAEAPKAFRTKIMKKHDVDYFHCENCGLMQPEEPHWLDEAYARPMNLSDTGIIMRNSNYSRLVGALIFCLLDKDAKFLDFAGGYGIFTRMMRDIGFDYYWHDIYTKNLVAAGFEFDDKKDKAELLTAFETFEHFVQPVMEVEKMLAVSDTMIFSTTLLPEPTPKPEDWWYYGLEHGQHTALYRRETLQYIADQFGLQFYTNGGDLHMFTKKLIIPKVVSREFFDTHLANIPGINKHYKLESMYKLKLQKSALKETAKNFYRKYRFGEYYHLQSKISAEESAELHHTLAAAGVLQPYYIDVLTRGEYIFQKFVAPAMQSRTFDDMLQMGKLMHVS